MKSLDEKNQPWTWEPEQEKAFKCLKEALISSPVLTIFDSVRETSIYPDVCHIGLVGLIIQKDNKVEKVIGYYSKTTSNTEQKYQSFFELETLAIVKP